MRRFCLDVLLLDKDYGEAKGERAFLVPVNNAKIVMSAYVAGRHEVTVRRDVLGYPVGLAAALKSKSLSVPCPRRFDN